MLRKSANPNLFERLMDASIEDTWYGKFRYNYG